ncbi:MAG: glycerol-3-phosphate acyltransferase, partial [Anaerolineales bacterium]|nr:glycerol-3-phosphate acyltransferase [Anaerolineales bacterium]
MQNLLKIGFLILAYCVGSIPWGYILVKVFKGKDIREIESGRTGGTNAMRASGFSMGFT